MYSKMAGSLWLSVKILCVSSALFGSKTVSCSEEQALGKLIMLSRLQEEQYLERRVEVLIEGSKHRNEVQQDTQ